jgi:hypothetical protein
MFQTGLKIFYHFLKMQIERLNMIFLTLIKLTNIQSHLF